jgi:hypothetical protein
MESAENRKPVSLSSHSPWKSLRDSHIPTAPAALPLSQIKSQKGFSRISLSFRLILRLENAGAPLECRGKMRMSQLSKVEMSY